MLCVLVSATACLAAQEQEPAPTHPETHEGLPERSEEQPLPEAPEAAARPGETVIFGIITDRSGEVVSGSRIVLQLADHSLERVTTSAADGTYGFHGVPPGSFTLVVSRDMYVTRSLSGTLQAEESLEMPQVILTAVGGAADAQVVASVHEVAAEQVRLEEKQRVLGIFPNFYISYIAHPAALSPKQKFGLAGRATIDPVNLALTGVVAGIEQAADVFPGYGQGASGFGKRYGAGFADGAISTMLGGAVLPTVFRQDPRYFWKGEGTRAQRARYAMTRIFICKGDNGKWQPNYSNILGNLASAGISNLYYPASDREGAGLTIGNALIGTVSGALANLYQEFFSRRMTPSASRFPAVVNAQ